MSRKEKALLMEKMKDPNYIKEKGLDKYERIDLTFMVPDDKPDIEKEFIVDQVVN